MNKIIQCTTLINNGINGDFQMRVFEYKSFKKLINDFETKDDINICNNSTMFGNLRPRQTIIENIIKDDYHAEYMVYGMKNTINVKFYKCSI